MDAVLVDPTLRFERLVQLHQREVWRYLRYLGAEPNQADDLTQETFLEVWRRPFVEYSDRASAAYLRRVAKNRLLMRLRREGRRPAVTGLEQADVDFEQHVGEDSGDEKVEALRECLETLKDVARRALDLIYRERTPRAEVAEALDLKPEGLKTLLRRSKVRLRECVERRVRQEEQP